MSRHISDNGVIMTYMISRDVIGGDVNDGRDIGDGGDVDDGEDDAEDPSSNGGNTVNVTHLPHVWYYVMFSVVFHVSLPPFSDNSTTVLRRLNNRSEIGTISLRETMANFDIFTYLVSKLICYLFYNPNTF